MKYVYVFKGEIRRKTPESPHQHLSEVQYRGYFGDVNDVELAMYFFENTLALEKFIVDPSVEFHHNCEDPQKARDRAMLQLQPKVPQGVKLLIL
ncbi:hypothetical protein CQW23_15144 [Capsicum baccatum]|uniref:FBD domain-containing protein n=1 Tax=Capsicum baccatum TaxID=33114 RepID=A0A2G2WL74_CAPBA|nr:hypothetical protein CQW23_15144 [Capsicum baccatum]